MKERRRFLERWLSPLWYGDPLTPCCPKRIVLTLLPTLATTMWDLVGWRGVRLHTLYLLTPARASRLSRERTGIYLQ